MRYDRLINKDHPLGKEYVPDNLVVMENPYTQHLDPHHIIQLEDQAANAFYEMQKEAKKAGYEIYVDSGYRSGAYQAQILEAKLAEIGEEAYHLVALPGCSEHQSGLAFDIGFLEEGKYNDNPTGEEETMKWVYRHAPSFGFILRYPRGATEVTGIVYEPWHFRYVGNPLALRLTEENLVLEEK